jgi:hypothetical protein
MIRGEAENLHNRVSKNNHESFFFYFQKAKIVMKKTRILLTAMVILLATAGAFVVKANESKLRLTASAVYYDNGGFTAVALITSSVPTQFQVVLGGSPVQALIRDTNGNPHLLYQEANKVTPVYFVP